MVDGEEVLSVVNAGASFAGLYVARELAADRRFRITIIEPKDFAECVAASESSGRLCRLAARRENQTRISPLRPLLALCCAGTLQG